MLLQGLTLAIIGMLVVFLILILLVFMMKLLSAFVFRFIPEQEEPVYSDEQGGGMQEIALAITAAYARKHSRSV